jgi:CheY-like chemotaxis protein
MAVAIVAALSVAVAVAGPFTVTTPAMPVMDGFDLCNNIKAID